jgi:organic radical activating enzyme
MVKGDISEIFYSVQGEGPYLGLPQVFVRFFDCNLECEYCDTVLSESKSYTPEGLWRKIDGFRAPFHSISLTGGEPLLQVDFLKEFLAASKRGRAKFYLETNGVLYREMARIAGKVDIIAMDIKLPSSTGLRAYWKEHGRFLQAIERKRYFVKCVITRGTKKEDLNRAVNLVKSFSKKVPFILQPDNRQLDKRLIDKAIEFQQSASKRLTDVRVIPQVHRLLGVR